MNWNCIDTLTSKCIISQATDFNRNLSTDFTKNAFYHFISNEKLKQSYNEMQYLKTTRLDIQNTAMDVSPKICNETIIIEKMH